MRDDDLLEVDLSLAPSVPLRGVRAAVVAPLVAIALAARGRRRSRRRGPAARRGLMGLVAGCAI